MGDTSIGWTNKSWSVTRGCERVSPGCTHCYAEKHAGRFCGPGLPFEGYATLGKNGARWSGVVKPLLPGNVGEALSRTVPARAVVERARELFEKDVPCPFIADVFQVMERCPRHTFQVLTKRADVMAEWFKWVGNLGAKTWPLPNVELGVSAENQQYAAERIPLLLQCPAVTRWVSVEPQLGHVDLTPWLGEERGGFPGEGIGWVVNGGESGSGARQFDLAWARSLKEQCAEAIVPYFFKQTGSLAITDNDDDRRACGDMNLPHPFQWKVTGKGASQDDHPEDLRVQEYADDLFRVKGR